MKTNSWSGTCPAVLSLILLCVWPLTQTSAAGLVLLEEDFNNENAGFGGVINYDDFEKFEVVAGSVDLIGNGFRDFFPGNGLYIDLDGTTVTGGTLQSKESFLLEPGYVYRLSYDLGNSDQQFGGGSTDNNATVSLGTAYFEEFERHGLAPFERIIRNIRVNEEQVAPIQFRQLGGDNLGILIDNVSLEVTTASSSDYDNDLDVDGADFLIWQRGHAMFDGSALLADGDGDSDGYVTHTDRMLWEQEYGSGLGTSPLASFSIPEPHSLVYGLLLLTAPLWARGLPRSR